MTPDGPGTYHVADGQAVAMEDAKAAWVPLAREVLLGTARVYNGIVHYAELADDVQSGSGIRTRQLVHYWIGDVLGRVSDECHRLGEPLLSSLCVRQDGTIGDGYAIALAARYGSGAPDDLEIAAAEERLRCYQHFGALLPADGGRPALPPEVALRRRNAAKRAREDARRPVCPSCFLELPATGQCDTCA